MITGMNYENNENTIRILVTTDNHVGFYENDPVRGDDAWKTFDEIMRIAKEQQVDMVLCAGDLFHVNKPSKKSYYEVIRTLRKNCLSDRPVELEMMYDGPLMHSSHDHDLPSVNYEDPNMNVGLPFFAISGNHDDVSGVSMLAAMDILSATGYVNYFGKVTENDNINVEPILLKKGETKLALYGFDSVRDERLFRTFRAGNVRFSRPARDEDQYFNLIAVHQNHAAHTETGYLREDFIPDFMDLVVWGHEHDCHPDPVTNPTQGFQVLQPGSSVATSLAEGESLPKHVVILNITEKKLRVDKVRLMTVRPFVFENVKLADAPIRATGSDVRGQVTRWMMSKVESLITRAKNEWIHDHPDLAEDEFPLPLIRLRIEHTNQYALEHPLRFSGRFAGRVANVGDVVQYLQRKTGAKTTTRAREQGTILLSDGEDDIMGGVKVQDLVQEELEKENLDLLSSLGLTEAINSYVEKDDRTVLKEFVTQSMQKHVEQMKMRPDLSTEELLSRLQLDDTGATTKVKAAVTRVRKKNASPIVEDDPAPTVSANPRKTARKAATTKRKRGNSSSLFVSDDELELSDEGELVVSSEEEYNGDDISIGDEPPVRVTETPAVKSKPATRVSPVRGRGRGRGGRRGARV